jgi:tetratricopeptide (TPR) repeat protein
MRAASAPAVEPATSPARPAPREVGGDALEAATDAAEPAAPRGRTGTGLVLALGLAVGLVVGALVLPPSLVQALPWRPAAARIREGNAAVRRGDLDAAVARYREAAELDPGSAAAWRNLGAAYALKGDQVQSVEAYRKYLELAQSPEEARAVREMIGEK